MASAHRTKLTCAQILGDAQKIGETENGLSKMGYSPKAMSFSDIFGFASGHVSPRGRSVALPASHTPGTPVGPAMPDAKRRPMSSGRSSMGNSSPFRPSVRACIRVATARTR
ncbi:hypothetical protein GCM10027570_06910 [Streptomonospora sediminis]